jgi:hypothetical protein
VLFPVVLGGDFRSPLLVISSGCFRDLSLRGFLGCDSPPKSVSKGARFWSFPGFRVRGALGGISSIPPFGRVLVGLNLAMDSS